MKHLVFATFELHPVTPGGAGVFIAGAIQELSRAGYDVTVLADVPEQEVASLREFYAGIPSEGGELRIQSVASLLPNQPLWLPPDATAFEVKSQGFARALEVLHAVRPVDLVEFPEYGGMAYWSLRERLMGGPLSQVPIAVRIHGSLELIDAVQGSNLRSLAHHRMYRMERLSLKMADVVWGPSKSLCELYGMSHGIFPDRLRISPPPMNELLKGLAPAERMVDPGHILFYGKLQEVKGCDILAEAAVSLLASAPEPLWRFTFVGRDTPCERHQRMTTSCLHALIPPRLRAAFEFIPSIPRAQLPELARRPLAAVIPSRFESFCLAAHELRAVGIPVVVPRIPAFMDWATPETGWVTFDGSPLDLRQKLLALRADLEWAEALGARPRPTYPPYAEAYQNLPVLHHGVNQERQGIERAHLLHELGTLDAMYEGAPGPRAWK